MVVRAGGDGPRGRLLFVGDIHLGRNPVRLPPEADDPLLYGPVEAWRRTVELALRAEVAAVVLAGDVVESMEDRFEAAQRLADGLERLAERGIPVLAVAGNHDVHALPRVARLYADRGFVLLGADGGWESVVVGQDGRPVCRVLGRSFVLPHEADDPLATLTAAHLDGDGDGDLATLGVLHCDRDAPGSRYAPVTSAAFDRGAAGRVDGWFLGHVHRPDAAGLGAVRPVGYLGSLGALDPGEPGRHGPWLVEVHGRGRVRARQQALAPLRFESRALDVDGLDGADDAAVEDALFARVRELYRSLHDELGGDAGPLQALALRVTLRGAVPHPARVRRAAEALRARTEGLFHDLGRGAGRVRFYCETLAVAVTPAHSVAELAGADSAVGVLARQLLEAEVEPALLGRLRERLARVREGVGWPDVDAARYPQPDLRTLFERTAYQLLGELLEQQDASAAARGTAGSGTAGSGSREAGG